MQIAGGLYREQCCIPEWDTTFGSGGRAAAAIAKISPGTGLHTYYESPQNQALFNLKKLGITANVQSRAAAIGFSYFHPLSRPLIYPSDIELERPIHVSGDVVLRFGFLEGDATIKARRAVYDPQTWKAPPSFHANGSTATELAIVLNELELLHLSGVQEKSLAVSELFKRENAKVIVIKEGTKGATVFEKNSHPVHIPAYRSSKVFKIGTGDIFSVMFTHYWGERNLPPSQSADLASRHVAAYCNDTTMPMSAEGIENLKPINFSHHGSILIHGSTKTIGQRYTMEEARYVLGELGSKVKCPQLDNSSDQSADAFLIIAEGLDDPAAAIHQSNLGNRPIIMLEERNPSLEDKINNVTVTSDFSSALYFAAWAASEH